MKEKKGKKLLEKKSTLLMIPNLQEGMVGGSTTPLTNNNTWVGVWKTRITTSMKRNNNKGFCTWLWAQRGMATNVKRINTKCEERSNTKCKKVGTIVNMNGSNDEHKEESHNVCEEDNNNECKEANTIEYREENNNKKEDESNNECEEEDNITWKGKQHQVWRE